MIRTARSSSDRGHPEFGQRFIVQGNKAQRAEQGPGDRASPIIGDWSTVKRIFPCGSLQRGFPATRLRRRTGSFRKVFLPARSSAAAWASIYNLGSHPTDLCRLVNGGRSCAPVGRLASDSAPHGSVSPFGPPGCLFADLPGWRGRRRPGQVQWLLAPRCVVCRTELSWRLPPVVSLCRFWLPLEASKGAVPV